MQRNIKTSEQLTLPFGADASMCSREGSPASRSALQASGKARPMTVTSGRRCCEQFDLYDRAGSWAKTFTALLIGREGWYSSKCALTWKMRATPSKRIYFQLVPSTLPTDATECGLLPTPTAMEDRRIPGRENRSEIAASRMKSNMNLYTYIELPPTVQTQGLKICREGRSYPMNLKMLPTPTAIDAGSGRVNKSLSPNAKERPTLGMMSKRGLLPTPRAFCYKDAKRDRGRYNLGEIILEQYAGQTSQLSPLFVAEMMGFSPNWTVSPFRVGGESR